LGTGRNAAAAGCITHTVRSLCSMAFPYDISARGRFIGETNGRSDVPIRRIMETWRWNKGIA
jgi:hypothetical protein